MVGKAKAKEFNKQHLSLKPLQKHREDSWSPGTPWRVTRKGELSYKFKAIIFLA